MAENYTRYNQGVKSNIVQQLLDLNRRFYTEYGRDFSATRGRLQTGVSRVIESLHGDESILDLGCGNGELARTLSRRGHHGSYLGLDFSPPLLNEAEREAFAFPVEFTQADLVSNDWDVIARMSRQFFPEAIPRFIMRLPRRLQRLAMACLILFLPSPFSIIFRASNCVCKSSKRFGIFETGRNVHPFQLAISQQRKTKG